MWGEEALATYASSFYVRDGGIDHLGADVLSSPFFLFIYLMTFESQETQCMNIFSV